MLEFLPENAESLRARFSAALETVWDASQMFGNPEADRPGKHRRHIFDFPDGIRAIVSLDRSEETGDDAFLHFSFSVNAEHARAAGMDSDKVRRRLKEIPVEFLGFEPKISHIQTTEHAIHLVCPWPQEKTG
jgi:hypothetical protein